MRRISSRIARSTATSRATRRTPKAGGALPKAQQSKRRLSWSEILWQGETYDRLVHVRGTAIGAVPLMFPVHRFLASAR